MIGVGGQAAEAEHGRVAGDVGDRAPGEGIGRHANPVIVRLALADHVGEVQNPGAAAARELGVAGGGAHRQRQRGRVCDQHDLVEDDIDLDGLADIVAACRDRFRYDQHALHGGRDSVHGVSGLLRDRSKVEHRRRACGRCDGAARKRVGCDADAVGVAVAVDHRVTEPEGVGAAAREVGGGAVEGADGQRELGFAADVDHLAELDLHVDRVVLAVGACRGGDAHVGDRRADKPGPHGMARVGGQTFEVAPRFVAGTVDDGASGQRMGSGTDADAVGVAVAIDHRVTEPQSVGAAAGRVAGGARSGTDQDLEARLAADVDHLVEPHVHGDGLIDPVRVVVGFRADRDLGDDRRNPVDVRIHLVLGIRRQRRNASFGAFRRVAGRILDQPADDGVRADADAVVVAIVGSDPVFEHQRVGAAAVGVGGRPGLGADADLQGQLGGVGDVHGFVEHGHEFDCVAETVPGVPRGGHDAHLLRAGAHRVDAVRAIGGERREVASHDVAVGILNPPAEQGVGAGRDADAVVVHVAGLHHVAKAQLGRAAAVDEGGPPLGAADGQRELKPAAAQHKHRVREHEDQVDGIAVAVGPAPLRW